MRKLKFVICLAALVVISGGGAVAWKVVKVTNSQLPQLHDETVTSSFPQSLKAINPWTVQFRAESFLLLPLTFEATFRGCKPGWVQGYRASDGEDLIESCQPPGGLNPKDWSDPKKAIRKELQENVKLLEETKKTLRDGKETKRYLVSYTTEEGERRVKILWADGISVCRIDAPSLRHALALEAVEDR